jgi:hypothetical protein
MIPFFLNFKNGKRYNEFFNNQYWWFGGFISNDNTLERKIFLKEFILKTKFGTFRNNGFAIKTDFNGDIIWSSYLPGEVQNLLLSSNC